jgi:galactokinase
MELINDTTQRYRKIYGADPEIVVIAPGRVNLIGEHTDYNNGYVLPVAIDRQIIIAAGRRNDDALHLHTADLQSSVIIPLSNVVFDHSQLWTNYPAGVAHLFQVAGYPIGGANFCVRGNIPIAAGLSSSAAIEIASALAFRHLYNIKISILDLIKLAQRAEVEFVGVLCGIMDQFVSVMGKKHHALFLDCMTLEYQHIPCPQSIRLIICDTGMRRELVRSAYNQRKAECEEAVRQLSKQRPNVKSLRDLSIDEFQDIGKSLPSTLQKRSFHVITENERVLKCVRAMNENDLAELGKCMIESHMSLRDNYEVSCKELDAFVDIAMESEGVYGARMTGAGFGGSAICIVDEADIDSLVERLRVEYPKHAGRSLTIYLASTDDGAAIIRPGEPAQLVGFV